MPSESNTQASTASQWSNKQAYTMCAVCLVLGLAVGYLIPGSSPENTQAANPGAQQVMANLSPEAVKDRAAPLLAAIRQNPNNADALVQLGNLYSDATQYSQALEYYERAAKLRPNDVAVHSDLGLCYMLLKSPDKAVAEFEKGLSYDPNNATILFNLGLARWQGRMDPSGAVAAWQQLLDTNPDFPDKAKVVELMARARQHAESGTTGKMPAADK
ncbi:MAG: tetratricopeptide repeat protein [Acidobacteria bacterium]|nr:tetratricopeptide repeat protein [Acidobacteriota bacterium]